MVCYLFVEVNIQCNIIRHTLSGLNTKEVLNMEKELSKNRRGINGIGYQKTEINSTGQSSFSKDERRYEKRYYKKLVIFGTINT